MRLPLILAMLAAAAPAASAGPAPAGDMPLIKPGPVGSQAGDCPAISRFHATKSGGGLKAQKLDELPMADTYAAAYRRIVGCEVPIMVRYGVADQGR